MDFGFGMKTDDIEFAREIVERVTGLTAIEKEHVDMGGLYYAFDRPDKGRMILIRNFDIYDLEPFIDGFDDWPVVLFVDDVMEDSPIVQALLREKQHFSLQEKRLSLAERKAQ